MFKLQNNKGIALVTSLMFTLISLGIIMALLAIVTQGTRVSGANKSYKTAIDAGYGAVDVVARDIFPAVFRGVFDAGLYDEIDLEVPLAACFNQKVSFSTLNPDGTSNWSSCAGNFTSLLSKESPDLTFNLKAINDLVGFKVYTKISDTRCGGDTAAGQPCTNSDNSGIDYLDAGSGVTSSSGSVTPQHRPAYFRIEVQSERAVNPNEKSQLSVLYGY